MVQPYIENLNLKVFEEKYEKAPEQQWARSLCDPLVYNALPVTNSRKVFEVLDFK